MIRTNFLLNLNILIARNVDIVLRTIISNLVSQQKWFFAHPYMNWGMGRQVMITSQWDNISERLTIIWLLLFWQTNSSAIIGRHALHSLAWEHCSGQNTFFHFENVSTTRCPHCWIRGNTREVSQWATGVCTRWTANVHVDIIMRV